MKRKRKVVEMGDIVQGGLGEPTVSDVSKRWRTWPWRPEEENAQILSWHFSLSICCRGYT